MKIRIFFLAFLMVLIISLSDAQIFSQPTTSFQAEPSSFQSYYDQIDPNLFDANGKNIQQSYADTYWPILKEIESGQCEATSDFLIMIPPAGCTPSVVRSDLLAEQNVPVFCQLDSIKINPLIDVSTIKSISFKGKYPEEVAGISFHPARAAVRTYNTLLGSPIINNIGYVVIILKKQTDERNLKEFISGNLTATVYYDAEEAFGVGQAEFYLPVMSDENWSRNYERYGFWSGRGFLRAEEIEEGEARISIYTDANRIFKTMTLKEGDTSNNFYFPGFYCRAGLKVKLNDIVAPEKQAELNIDGNEIWVREGSSFLNGKCKVNQINALQDGTGSISIKCPGENINLVLSRKGAVISYNNAEKSVKLGEKAGEGWYAAYIGIIPETIKELDKRGKEFVLIANTNEQLSDTRLRDVARKIAEAEAGGQISFDAFAKKIRGDVSGFFTSKKIGILTADGNSWYGVGGVSSIFGAKQLSDEEKELNSKFKFIGFEDVAEEDAGLIDDYFNQAKDFVNELLKLYPQEKKNLDRFGESALWNQIEIAKMIGKQKTARELLERFIELYPDAGTIIKAKEDYRVLSQYDLSKAYTNSYINNEFHFISVNGFEAVGAGQKGVGINIGGTYWIFDEGDKINLENPIRDEEPEINGEDYLLVNKINSEEVNFVYYEYNPGLLRKYTAKSLDTLREAKKEGDNFEINNIPFEIEDIRIKQVAKVSLIPEVKLTQSDANFTFRIGIEDRGIKLSPDKTKEMIENLNKSLEKWKNINEKMINLIKGWKGACFATSAVMILKNSIFAGSGKSIARERVMQDYRNLCDTNPEYREMTKTECYNKLSKNIDDDVEVYAKILKEQSDAIEKVNKNNIADRGGLFEEDVVNTEKALNQYKNTLPESVEIDVPGEGRQTINKEDITSFSQAQAVDEYIKLQNSDASQLLKDRARKEMSEKLLPTWRNKQNEKARQGIVSSTGLPSDWIISDFSTGATRVPYSGKKAVDMGKYEFSNGESVELIKHSDNQYYLFSLIQGVNTNSYGVGNNIWRRVGDEFVKLTDENKINELQNSYTFVTGGICSNNYLSPEVRFYESEPNAQLPAVVPFDVEEGWYVKVPQSLGGIFGTKEQGYQISGDVSFFWICNVGENRLEENRGGDDICQSFDVNTYESVSDFIECPELNPAKVQELAGRARSAVRQAASQYGKDRNLPIIIQSGNKRYEFKRGGPARGDGELVECQDFMSPSDCKILFNVCDPVICPPSRCDFGGKIPTADVIQSGIIGSLILCLPNAQEGVLVPICISGVQAGLDSYISILQAEKDCLQNALDTGRSTGICDEVTAVYECDFFWRQVAPFTNLLIPKIVQFAYTGSVKDTRGGGEYLSFQQSWDKLGQSVDFFREYYAKNAFRAFQIRSWQEAGSEFCRAFVGTSFPTSADAIDSLLEPESPYQFYARFDEVPFTSATVPATSQYKIYYHIYAGRDQGVRYHIYLKNPPATGYYVQNPILSIKTGYIPKGEMVDETIDRTAPSGYKELCVDINGKEECGFQQVTTSFALDYLSEKYVQSQVETTDIKTEKECISGSQSLWSAVNPNLQAGLEESVEPEIAMRGIVRVCSRGSPGEATDTEKNIDARWRDVGYCGAPDIRCWLDTNSVKGDLDKVITLEEEIDYVQTNLNRLTKAEKISIDTANDKLTGLREEVRGLKVKLEKIELTAENINLIISPLIKKLDEISSIKGAQNVQKAEAIGLKAQVNQIVARKLYDAGIKKPEKKEEPEIPKEEEPEAPEKVEKYYLKDNKIYGADENYTGLFVVKAGENYIVKAGNYPEGKNVGTIINEVIDFNFFDINDEQIIFAMQDLEENYKLDEQTKNFVLKEEAPEVEIPEKKTPVEKYTLKGDKIYLNDNNIDFVLKRFGDEFELIDGYYIYYIENMGDYVGTITIIDGRIRLDENFIESINNKPAVYLFLDELSEDYIFDNINNLFYLEKNVGMSEQYRLDFFRVNNGRIYYAEIYSYIIIESGRVYAFVGDEKLDIGRVSDSNVIFMEENRYRGKISGKQLDIIEFLNGKQIQGGRVVFYEEKEEVQPKARKDKPVIYLQDEFSFYIEGPYSLPNYFEGDIIEGIYIQYNNIYFNSVVLGSVDFIGDIYYKISLTKESALTYLPMETYDILNGAIITGKNIFVECKIDNINTFYRSGGQFGAAGIIFTSSDPNCEGRDASVVLKRKDWGGIVGWINPDNVINKNIIKFIKDGNSYIAQQDFSLSEKANFYFEFECWTCNLQEGQQDVVTPDSEEACKIIKKPYWTDINRKKIASAKDKTEIRFNVEGIGLFCDKFQVELWKESANGKLEIYDDSLSGVFTFLNNKGEIKYTLDKKKIRGALGSSYNLFFRIKYGKDFSNTIDSEKIKFR